MAVANPTISPDADTYDYAIIITMETTTAGANIYYTDDNTTPDVASNLYIGPFALASTAIIKAIGIKSGESDSGITAVSYTINAAPARHTISGNTYIEAEAAQTIDNWQHYYDDRAINDVFMQPYDDDNDTQTLSFDVDADNGTYYMWVRVWAVPYSRIRVRLDGGAFTNFTAGTDSDTVTGHTWHWLEVPTTYAMNGNHTIDIRRQISSYASSTKLDRIFFTTDSGVEPPELLLLHPNGGERWYPGTNQTITWQSQGDVANVQIEYSIDSGETWTTITASTADDGSYEWTSVPGAPQAGMRVRITDTGGSSIFSESDGDFQITYTLVPYTSSTIHDRLNLWTSEDPWNQLPTRSDYLDDVEDDGALRRRMAFRNTFNLGGSGDHLPDTVAFDRYRLHNNNQSLVIAYNNLYNVDDWVSGEAMMGDISANPTWMLYDTLAAMVQNPTNGRDCFFFRETDLLDYFVARAISYCDAGSDGMEFDSFDVMRKHVFENGYWYSTYPPYANPITVEDTDTALEYTASDWIYDLKFATHYIRVALDAEYGKDVYKLFINGAFREHWLEFGDDINGFFNEAYGGASTLKATVDSSWFTRNEWEMDLDALISFDLEDQYTVLGCGRVSGAPWTQTQGQAALYCVASALLGIRGGLETMMYMRPISWNENTMGADLLALKMARFVPLGRYEKTGDDIYKREFAHALVYVNPTEATTVNNVALPAAMYYMQDDGAWSAGTINQFDIDPGRGAIFVEDKTWAPLIAATVTVTAVATVTVLA